MSKDWSTPPNKPGLYAIQFDNGIKIGRSKNLKDRLSIYNRPWVRPILNRRWITCTPQSTHLLPVYEKELIKRFNDKRNGEFLVGVTFDEILQAIRDIHEKFSNR